MESKIESALGTRISKRVMKWKDGLGGESVLQSKCYSCRGPTLRSQHPPLSCTSSSRDSVSSSDFHGQLFSRDTVPHPHMHIIKIEINEDKKIK